MGIIKDTVEEASVTIDKMLALRSWASVSFLRTLLVMSLVGIALLTAQYIYVNSLLTEVKKERRESNTRNHGTD